MGVTLLLLGITGRIRSLSYNNSLQVQSRGNISHGFYVYGGEVELWIGGFVKDKLMEGGRTFFDQYCTWHDQKGYWKQEDYFGGLING